MLLKRFRFPLLLLLFCFIAYLPLSSFLFSLKNDAFVFNFPNKFFFSEAIKNGLWPTWNPYLNFGFPLYADPGFAWWNPMTWVFGIIGYNAYTFSIEVLFYIYLAGLGMYWLGTRLHLSKKTSFAIGSMFMCSGFFVGNLQHINFLTCSAFLPWFFCFWWKFQQYGSIKNLLGCCLFAYLLSTGGHPAIPIATAFVFLCLTILYPFVAKPDIKIGVFFLRQLKLIFGIALFLTPLFVSYYQILPYYNRFGPSNQQATTLVGFTPQSYISFLFPVATVKNFDWYETDISMRNAYFSIPGFLFFLVFLYQRKKNVVQRILLIIGLVMLVLSLGGVVKEKLYSHLPVFSWIRTNGEFRVFVIFSFLICTSFELDAFLNSRTTQFAFKKLLSVVLALCILGIIILLFLSQHFRIPQLNGESLIDQIKNFIDDIQFKQCLLAALFIVGLLSLAYILILKKSNQAFLLLLLLDITINCWLLLPITGVGKTSVRKMQHIIDKSPQGFPSPLSVNNTAITTEDQKLISNWSWYDKKIIHTKIDYPSQLQSTENFYNSKDTEIIRNKPFIFLSSGLNSIKSIYFKPNSFKINVSLSRPDTLIILQNYFPGWKARANNNPATITKYLNTFMAIPLRQNDLTIQLNFYPLKI